MGAMTAIRKKTSMARIGAHMAWERLTDPRPTRRTSVPRSAEFFTREWLTSALCHDVPGAEVVAFTFLGDANMGTTARRRMEVSYNAAGEAVGLPKHLFAKATPEFASRFVCGLSGAIAHEVEFYNRIVGLTKVETPVCYHADYDPGSFRSIFLFEDAGVTKGAQFLSGLYRMSRQEAETMVKVIATLHSRFWGDPILDTQFTWLKDAYAYQLHINDLIGFKERTTLGLERSLKLLPGDLPGKKNLLWPAMMRATELRSQAPRTLLHADIHLGNWYITDSRAMGLCDWQCTVKGQWAVDFAYAVTSSLEPDERRAWERDLLKLYLDSLELPAGQVKPTMEEAWLAYRQQTLHGLYNWFFVAGISASETEMHSNAISASNLTRMATAAADLDTLGALGY